MPIPTKPSTTPRPPPMKAPPPATSHGHTPAPTTPDNLIPATDHGDSPIPAVSGTRVPAADHDDIPAPAMPGRPVSTADHGETLVSATARSCVSAADEGLAPTAFGVAALVTDRAIPVASDLVPTADSERGYVTAETALLLPVLLGIGYALALVVLIAADQIRCGDAAWEAARALARGVSAAQLPDIAARYAPAGAHASAWSKDGSLTVEVDRDQSVASRFLPSIRISATATVPCEPRVDGCQTESDDIPIPGRPNG